jgi:hypothetical protein
MEQRGRAGAAGTPLTYTEGLSGLGTVVSGQLAHGGAVRLRAHNMKKGLDPMVSLPSIGKAEIIDLFANVQEIQSGFLAHQAQTHARVGPSTANGLGNPAMVGGQSARGRSSA